MVLMVRRWRPNKRPSSASTQSQHHEDRSFLLDVALGNCEAALKLFALEDQTLMVLWDACPVLNKGLDAVDAERSLNLQSDALACGGVDEDLHVTTTWRCRASNARDILEEVLCNRLT